jgi:DNA-binding response OmpR family regulator
MKKRMLIIIDNKPDKKPIKELLVEIFQNDYDINVIQNTKDAAEIHCKTQNYSTVIIDNNAPSAMRGIDIIPQIRDIRPEIKIVLLSGGTVTEQEALAAGADALCRKPFGVDEIMAIVG